MRHEKEQSKKRSAISWVLIAIVVLGLVSGGVLAYLSTSTGPVTNTFQADAPTNPSISETMNDNTKTNVSVNVGDPGYAVYVRAAVVVTWKDTNGNVLAQAPVEGTDYAIDWNVDTATDQDKPWFKHGGFYYYESMVNTNGTTAVLINSCTPKVNKGDYTLSVEIIAQTIQALGTADADDTPAVENAWGVKVDSNGQLKAPTT